MHKDIISQNIKLSDTKMIINETKFEMIENVKYLVYYIKREFEPVMCDKCGKVVYKVKDIENEK